MCMTKFSKRAVVTQRYFNFESVYYHNYGDLFNRPMHMQNCIAMQLDMGVRLFLNKARFWFFFLL